MKTVPLSIYLSDAVLYEAATKAGLHRNERFSAILSQSGAYSEKHKIALVKGLAKKDYDRVVVNASNDFVRLQAADNIAEVPAATRERSPKPASEKAAPKRGMGERRETMTDKARKGRAPESIVEGLTVRMKQSKTTPGTVVFVQVDDKGKPLDRDDKPAIPTLYIRKSELPTKVPTFITVEVKFEK